MVKKEDLKVLAGKYGYEQAIIQAIISVESCGFGFARDTGKIIIQFEPKWFKRKVPNALAGDWSLNRVERQAREWIAFNNAFKINPNAAMESTSIGLMQVMGMHWKTLGFSSVGAMWDFAKVSEVNQVELGIKFIEANPSLKVAVLKKDWAMFAYYYNGSGYKRNQYDIKLKMAYEHFQKDI